MAGCNPNDCGMAEAIAQLRREMDEKHQQNRKDIHDLRNLQQKSALEMANVRSDIADVKGKIMPLVDNGQPGLISKIADRLEQAFELITTIRIAQGEDKGRRGESDWLKGAITAIIVGLIIALVQHFWK